MAVVIPEEQVGASTDDCQRFTVFIDTINLVALTFSAGKTTTFGPSATLEAGMRFTTVPIPNGVTIDSASVSIWATGGRFMARTKLRGEDADNPATFSTKGDFDARPRTTAAIDWDIPNSSAWHSPVEQWRQSPDISSVIQEIVDRPGWSSGNALVLFWADDGSASNNRATGESYDDVPSEAPKLNVTYTVAATGQVIYIETE